MKQAYRRVWQYPQTGMSRRTKLNRKEDTRLKTNVEHEVCDRSHRNSKTRFIEPFWSYNRKILRKFTTKGSYTWNIIHITREVLLSETWSGDHRWFMRRSRMEGRSVKGDSCIIVIIIIIIIISKSYTCNNMGSRSNSEAVGQHLSNIPGEHEIKELQGTAILCAAHTHTHTHTLREMLM